jgi:flagellar basal-body rod protein FlgG
MIRALSTSATGMTALQTKLDVTANNVANSQTAGFKKGRAEFEDLMYQTLRAPGANAGANNRAGTGLQVGLGVRVAGTSVDMGTGELKQTDNPLNLAIAGRGFFALQDPEGNPVYTRNGAFHLDAEGRIVNTEGYGLANEIVVPPDALSVSIGADGTVTADIGEPEPVELGQIELANFANPAGLQAMGKTLFTETAASGVAILGVPGLEGAGSLEQGMLEMSNVKVVEEMIDLISGQRAYEVNSRVVQAADEMLQQTSNLR